MKRTTIQRADEKRLVGFLKENHCILLLTVACIAGYILGLFALKADSGGRLPELCFDFFCSARGSGEWGRVFLSSLLFLLIFVLLSFISGLSLAGVPFIYILLVTRGFVTGALTASAVAESFFGGLLFSAVLIIIPAFLNVTVLILACRESLSFSSYLVRSLSFGAGGLMNDFRVYCTRYLVIVVFAVVSAGADSLLSLVFYRLLSLK